MAKPSLVVLLLATVSAVSAHMLCAGTGAAPAARPLRFCSAFSEAGCCSEERDAQLAVQWAQAGLHHGAHLECADVLRRVLCRECAPHAPLPVASNHSAPTLCGGLCERAYRSCRDADLPSNPFAPPGRTLAQEFPRLDSFAAAFCHHPALGEAPCYSGEPETELQGLRPRARQLQIADPRLCFERLTTSSGLNLVGHPANKKYALLGTREGVIRIVSLPPVGSRSLLKVVGTFLDISARVMTDGERGLLSFAFHPKYTSNGRFFVSYICNGNTFKDCQGPCECNANIRCTVGTSRTSCNGNTILAEYRVSNPGNVFSTASHTEVKRFLTFGRPYNNHQGGYIAFDRSGYLFYTSGDGGSANDPFNAAQNPLSRLGKVLRIDVDRASPGLNYSIPPSNPFRTTRGVLPEIVALGLRNPWRCAVDPSNGNIFCGDVGQNLVEEVDRILYGRNYGWSRLEGSTFFNLSIPLTVGKLQGPVFQYAHRNNVAGIPYGGVCVIGGVVYRAPRNTCLQGKYIFSDLIATQFVGTIYPARGQKPSYSIVTAGCAPTSPLPCTNGFGYVVAWGEDLTKDAYMLSSNGVFRLTDLSHCGGSC